MWQHEHPAPFRAFPFIFIAVIAFLGAEGTALLYSAAHGSFDPWAWRHLSRFVVFFVAMLTLAYIPVRFIYQMAYPVYLFALGLLILNFFVGNVNMGAARWLNIGGFNIQPAEPMKLALIMALARYFHANEHAAGGGMAALLPPLALIAVPAGLILIQPDLGTAFILCACGAAILFAAGLPLKLFFIAAAITAAAIPALWNFYLHDYQKKRVLVFLDPESDPLGSGYNIMQSMIAIGSGGMFGKGHMQGTQGQLEFLPEHQTDFIFTLLSEEWGFVGAIATLCAYMFLCLRGLMLGAGCGHFFGKLLASGFSFLLFVHVTINIAMISGLMPVVGVPLPLLSYGGTIMMTMMIAFGLMLNTKIYADAEFGGGYSVRGLYRG